MIADVPGSIGLRLGLTRETPLPFLDVGTEEEISFPRLAAGLPLPSIFTA